MWGFVWPIALIVLANTFYNLCTKSAPGGLNAFAALFVTYLTAAGACLLLYFLTSPEKRLLAELGRADWTSFVLGAAIVGLEFGYLAAYRAGWRVSSCSLTANILLACVLLAVGAAVYREAVSLRQLLGMAVCGLGLFLISGHG